MPESGWRPIADVVDQWRDAEVEPWERTSAEPQDTRRKPVNLEDHDDDVNETEKP